MKSIRVHQLGKAYKIYENRWARMMEWLRPGHQVMHRQKWVLHDISFEVSPGEAVGIIGINGAGKSTLLKIITGTTKATTGTVTTAGKVAALLELGMGFHPDFTGRQNVFMAAQLQGMGRAEIESLMPTIESFAEIGDYFDSPVRIYSSGMQMRLAFSVATARRPDLLIVDEALSVGDAYFQHKSIERIRKFNREGTSLLLVSHDKQAIQSLCDRAILLSSGHLAMQGQPEEVMDYYNAMLSNHQPQEIHRHMGLLGKIQTVSGSSEAVIETAILVDENDQPLSVVKTGQHVSLRVAVSVHAFIDELVLGYKIKDRLGQAVFGTNTYHLDRVLKNVNSGQRIQFDFSFLANLGPGSYSIAVALHSGPNHLERNYEWRDLALIFNVVQAGVTHFVGQTWLPPVLRTTHE